MKDNKTDEKTYVVYCHTCPDGMQYYGMSGNVKNRWCPSGYKTSKHFYEAIIKFGWENIKHEVLYNDLTRDKALEIEDELIANGWSNGTCLNMFRSGHYTQSDEYKEKENARKKDWYEANKDKVIARSSAWNKAHPEKHNCYTKAWSEANPNYHKEYNKRRKGKGDNK